MRFIEKYAVVVGTSWGDLSDEVDKYLEDGYIPFGSPFTGELPHKKEYVQPVMKMNTSLDGIDQLTEELVRNAGQ